MRQQPRQQCDEREFNALLGCVRTVAIFVKVSLWAGPIVGGLACALSAHIELRRYERHEQ